MLFYLCTFILPDKKLRKIGLSRIPLTGELMTIHDTDWYATYRVSSVETITKPDTGETTFLLTLTNPAT